MYSSLGARSTVRESTERDLLTRPACGRPNARTRRLNHPRHVVSLHAPSRRRRACGDHATSRPATGARGTNAKRVRCARRADAAARETSNPVRRGARLAETAIARETAARRRRGGPGSLSLSLSLSPLSVDRRDEAPSSSSKRSARVQLCWPSTPGAAAAAAAATYIQRITVPAPARRLVDDPRAVGPKGPWRRPGAAGRPSRTLRRGCLYGRAALRHAATCNDGPRQGPSATPPKTGFKRHELNSCVGRGKS